MQQQIIPKQQIIPYKDFEPSQLVNRTTARKNAKGDNEEILKIPLEKVVFRMNTDGTSFNPRTDYGDLQELAASLRANGQLEAGRVDALSDNRFAVVEGHRRVAALFILRDEDRNDSLYFRAALNKMGTTEKERLLQAFITQTGKPLEQYELSNLFSRLINDEGMTQVELSEVTGKSPAYISQLITFSKEPAEIKEFVRMGKLTVNDAIKLKSKIKDSAERIDAIKSADEKKWEKNEKRQDDFADNYEYDEDLKRTIKKEVGETTDPDDIVKHIDNTVKGKKLKLEEIVSSNTVVLPKRKLEWISVDKEFPKTYEVVLISNGNGWTSIGCRVNGEGEDEWLWAESNGTVYEMDGVLTAQCDEGDDLDVKYWHRLPNPIKK